MQFNQNYPWYLQTSPNFSVLYEGVFNVARNFSPLDAYKVFYPDVMAMVPDNLGAMYGLKVFAGLWQLPTEFSAIEGALIYDVGSWSTTDKWNGDTTGVSIEWFLRYIKMKTFINQSVFCLQTIKDAFAILFGSESYNVTVTETEYAITINIDVDSSIVSTLMGILAVDSTLFGKPMGKTITYNLGD